MGRQDLEKLYERAALEARSKGYHDEAYDFAGWIATEWLEGKRQHQSIRLAFIDYLRKFHGGVGKRRGADGLLRSHRAAELPPTGTDQPSIEESFDRRAFSAGSFEGRDPEHALLERDSGSRHYGTYGHPIKGGIRFLFEEGFTQVEIGDIYGLTESRICQILGEVRREIERDAGLERMREKIECDETELEIEWLSI